MPPTLTNRELKNKTTGIDIIVPEYQVIPGRIISTVLYHVIVITKLFYFKTRQHKESDVVQFAVAKKYEEIEDLHTKLVAKFPSVPFPSLPKMSLIVTEKVIEERKKFLENFLNLVACTPKLCSTSPVLTFLEVNKISIKQNQLKTQEIEKPKEEIKEEKKEEKKEEESPRDIFGVTHYESSGEENSSEEVEDIGIADMKRPSDGQVKQLSISTQPGESKTDEFMTSDGKFSFGRHDDNEKDVSDLFIPQEARKSDDISLFVSEDDPDLLEIEDDLDKLLNVSKKNDKVVPDVKPRAPPRPDLKPRPTPKPRFVETSSDIDFLAKPSTSAKQVSPPKPKPRVRRKVSNEAKTEKKPKKDCENSPRSTSETLDEIFGNKDSKKDLFSGIEDDEVDLFKPASPGEDFGADDITKYIEKNMKTVGNDDVDLFS